MSINRMPDFLIIGAAKSGTTSLYLYLQQHPQIFLPSNKEPFFFTFEGKNMKHYHYEGNMRARSAVVELEEYQNLFKNAPASAKVGEASTLYLSDKDTPRRIKQYIPSVRQIAILRNPIDRAYSHYQHFRKDGFEPLANFSDAVFAEPERMRQNWFKSYFYVDAGFYSKQFHNYFQYFPKSQFKIFLYEDFLDSACLLKEICSFIDVDPDFPLDTSIKYNISGSVRLPWLYKWMKNSTKTKQLLRKIIPLQKWGYLKRKFDSVVLAKNEPMTEEVRDYLRKLYHDDIYELQEILNRDLSHWLT